jgi:peptide-methionine (S)-S-oxide reductase
MNRLALAVSLAAVALLSGCDASSPKESPVKKPPPPPPTATSKLATFGGGCFWCVEALFQRVAGVEAVASGYSGGDAANPTYEEVCSGRSGHAEAVQVRYDASKVTYETLLEIFWKTHDPTTLNRQGNDVGTQYRSVVFFHDEEQHRIALEVKAAIEQAGIYDRPIVTQIVPFERFWKAEAYHQNYFEENPDNRYCQAVIPGKFAKLEKLFKDRLKK